MSQGLKIYRVIKSSKRETKFNSADPQPYHDHAIVLHYRPRNYYGVLCVGISQAVSQWAVAQLQKQDALNNLRLEYGVISLRLVDDISTARIHTPCPDSCIQALFHNLNIEDPAYPQDDRLKDFVTFKSMPLIESLRTLEHFLTNQLLPLRYTRDQLYFLWQQLFKLKQVRGTYFFNTFTDHFNFSKGIC